MLSSTAKRAGPRQGDGSFESKRKRTSPATVTTDQRYDSSTEKAMATDKTADEARLRGMLRKQGIDYIRYMAPDVHGLLRGKVYPAETVDCAGEPITICSLTFSLRGPPALPPEQKDLGYGNIIMRPLPDTLLTRSWRKNEHGAKVAQVMCELFYTDGRRVEADIRQKTKEQLDRLAKHGLSIYSGTEFEFRVYKRSGNDWEPGHNDIGVFLNDHLDLYENFMIDLHNRMKQCDIGMYTMHAEAGRGQLEIPTIPSWGIDIADQMVLLKILAKETALDNNLRVSFMTKDLLTEFCNGSHFNHSIWYRSENSNALLDPKKEFGLSDLGRHWLAGLIHHAPALTALCCPTVNCYRRVGTPWAPHYAEWGKDSRLTSFRLKGGTDAASTCIENRMPSGPSSPYLVLAGTVAAGLDGIERKLELPAQQAETRKELPRTLPAALDALKADSVICKALGQTFVDWFVFVKEEEIEHLRGVDVAADKADDIERERADYLFFV